MAVIGQAALNKWLKECIEEEKSGIRQGYFYIIPARLAEGGKPLKALLFGLIVSLANKIGYCYATNRFLAEKLKKKSISHIVRLLKELEKERWIKMEINEKQGNKRRIWILHFGEKVWKT